MLGSCISVILWHPKLKIGAISHSLLDTRHNNKEINLDSKYCDEAITMMVNELKLKGINAKDCQAKIFGGASLIPQIKTIHIGERNCQTALSVIDEYNIPIIQSDVLGKHHRKISFDFNTGQVACNA